MSNEQGAEPEAGGDQRLDDHLEPGGMSVSGFMAAKGLEGGVDLDGVRRDRSESLLGLEEDGWKYEIGEEVARGGMGSILAARDHSIRRHVALKVMRQEQRANSESVVRFVEEAQVTGQLEHPNIIPVHELGVDGVGNVFYTMKFVEGVSLQDILEDVRAGEAPALTQYPLNHLLNIFLKICDAIAFAHSKGVIHRDLKPGNIMVGRYGEVLVLDWGLAKVVGGETAADPAGEADSAPSELTLEWIKEHIDSVRQDGDSGEYLTMEGAILGTPLFMAPEQAYGRIGQLDGRTDIYALGAILYNILTLHPPVEGDTSQAVLLRVAHGQITPVSEYNSQSTAAGKLKGRDILKRRDLTMLGHCPDLRAPESLAAVAMKALALKPADRYQSVSELQREIESYQSGHATVAEDAGFIRQFRLLIGRNKGVSLSISAAVLVLLVVAGLAFARVTREKSRAVAAGIAAEHARQQAEDSAAVAVAERQAADKARADLEYEAYFMRIALGHKKAAERSFAQLGELLDACRPEMRHWEWWHLKSLMKSDLATLAGGGGPVIDAAYSPDGKKVAAAAVEGEARVWDVADRQVLFAIGKPNGHGSVSFSPNGKVLAVGGGDGAIRLCRTEDGRELKVLRGHRGLVRRLSFSPNGKLLASGGVDRTAKVWRVDSGEMLLSKSGHGGAVKALAFSPDGKRVASAGDQTEILVWDPVTGRERARLTAASAEKYFTVAFTPDGKHLAAGGWSGSIPVWDTNTGNLATTIKPGGEWVYCLAFSPDGERIAAGSTDKTVRVWNWRDGELLATLSGHSAHVRAVAFSPDGRRLVSGSNDGTAKVWNSAGGGAVRALRGHKGAVLNVDFSPDSTRLVSGAVDRTTRVWDLQSEGKVSVLEDTTNPLDVSFSPNGKWIAAARRSGGGQADRRRYRGAVADVRAQELGLGRFLQPRRQTPGSRVNKGICAGMGRCNRGR